MRERSSRTFKAGLMLEEAVCDGLAFLGVRHRRTEHRGKEDVQDRLDIIVYPAGGRRPLEIQLTLQPKKYPKLFAFALTSLTSARRGIRLYVEVVGAQRHADLRAVGRRVAQAIKLIMRRFRDFGAHDLLGVRIHAVTAKIEKFDLIDFCGSRLMRLVEEWRDARRLEREAARESAMSRRPPFWRAIAQALRRPTDERAQPYWHVPNTNSRAHFVPRRFCANN